MTNFSVIKRHNNRTAAHRPHRTKSTSSDNDEGGDDKSKKSGIHSAECKLYARNAEEEDPHWAPSVSSVFKIIVSLRMSAGIWSPLSDCDEVYNYWEPLHFLVYGSGFQTWEYSPVYAIRSYAYLWLHAIPLKVFQLVLPHTKVTSFFFLRCFLAFCSAGAEAYLYSAVKSRLGNGIARIFGPLTALSVGMFISSSAFLPSSFSMLLNTVVLALWLQRRYFLAVFGTALSALVGWPFAAILGVPVALEMLLIRKNWKQFVLYSVLCGWAICTVLMAVDSFYYGTSNRVLAPLNIILYNVFSKHGPNLYGTAPLSYYLINLSLNWNVAFPAAALCTPLVALALRARGGFDAQGFKWPEVRRRLMPVFFIHLSVLIWFAVFFSQPHKEERFMFPAYAPLALCAALTLDAIARAHALGARAAATALCVFVVLCGSRGVALYRNYHAPFDAFMALNEHLSSADMLKAKVGESGLNVCIGKEWHRFPSSFFLPAALAGTRNGTKVHLQFIKSEFRGQLPKPYAALPLPAATRHVPTEMNDENLEEASRYIPVEQCHYLVDLESAESTPLEPNYAARRTVWRILHRDSFLLNEKSHRLLRAFYVPYLSDLYCVFARYNVLERRDLLD